MRNPIRVPRVFLPRENFDLWASPACDRFPFERAFWENLTQQLGETPSARHCILPDAFSREEREEKISELQKYMCVYLESGVIERLNRGMILVERTTSHGLRRGILANIDLEEFAIGKEALIRPSTETLPVLVETRRQVRKESLLEFPHTVLLYRDKRDKILRSLDSDLELLYDFELKGFGRVAAYFIPNEDAVFVAHDLIARADPCFLVADGNHSLAAAKAYWEELKAPLSEEERENHPARFALVEFVNAAEESVVFEPIHRVIREIEIEPFCDFFAKNVKCKRENNVLLPILSGAESYQKVDEVIEEFIRQNYGRVEYRTESPALLAKDGDCVVVALPAVDKEELYAAAKSGKRFPAKTFCLGAEKDARYSLEGREITYD